MTRYRPSTGEWCLTLDDFRAVPFERLAAALGISSNRPRPPRRRRRRNRKGKRS